MFNDANGRTHCARSSDGNLIVQHIYEPFGRMLSGTPVERGCSTLVVPILETEVFKMCCFKGYGYLKGEQYVPQAICSTFIQTQ